MNIYRAGVVLLGVFVLVALAELPRTAAAQAPSNEVEHGKYLVTGGGCGDCHTPMKMGPSGPEPDAARLLSGHPSALTMPPAPKLPEGPWFGTFAATMTAWAGPWGVSFTANLTPDKETGLGAWTAQTFLDAVHSGRHMGKGRPILPPMPFSALQSLTDADLKAMFAYLQSIPAIGNRVPEPTPPEEAGAR